MKRSRLIAGFALVAVTALTTAGRSDEPRASDLSTDSGQIGRDGTPSLAIESLYGPDLFAFYCAACHGKDAKGSGPAARTLKTAPADLTAVAKRNGGVFPRTRVQAYVTGDVPGTAAHGSKEMPVWGPIFRALDPSDARTKVRMANLVAYIESLQEK